MNTQNFSIQSSLEANYLNIQLDEPIQLDEIALKTINNDCPNFLIPFQMLEVNGSTILKYKLINTIALEFIDSSYTRRDFIKLFLNLLNPLIKGNEWFLDYHCFCINPQYVYVDRLTNIVTYIYIPEDSYKNTDEEIFEFIKNTFVRMTITDDPKFQVDLYQFFAKDGVTLIDLYKMLQNAQSSQGSMTPYAAPVANPVIQQSAPASMSSPVVAPMPAPAPKPVTPAPAPVQEKQPLFGGSKKEKPVPAPTPVPAPAPSSPVGNDNEIIDQLFGGSSSGKKKEKPEKAPKPEKEKKEKKGGLFGKKDKGEPLVFAPADNTPKHEVYPSQQPAPAPSFPQQQNYAAFNQAAVYTPDSGVTVTLDDYMSNKGGSTYLELISAPIPGAAPRIELDASKPYITIGRMSSDEVQPDVAFPVEFKFIGRKHARIQNNNGKYFLIDLGSKNHTFLNGNMLVPNQMYELTSGSEVTFTESMPVKYRVNL